MYQVSSGFKAINFIVVVRIVQPHIDWKAFQSFYLLWLFMNNLISWKSYKKIHCLEISNARNKQLGQKKIKCDCMQKALCCFDHNRTLTWQKAVTFSGYFMLYFTYANVIHPKYRLIIMRLLQTFFISAIT